MISQRQKRKSQKKLLPKSNDNNTVRHGALQTNPQIRLTSQFREFVNDLDDNRYNKLQRHHQATHTIQRLYVWVSEYAKAVIDRDFLSLIKAEVRILDKFEHVDRILDIPEFTEVLKTALQIRKENNPDSDEPITVAEYAAAITARKQRLSQLDSVLTIQAAEFIQDSPEKYKSVH